jgi:prophage regulatory protein
MGVCVMIAATEDVAAPDKSELRKMLTEREVLQLIRCGRSTLWRLERSGKFPRGVYIAPNTKRWFEDQVIRWQRAIAEHDPHFDPARGRGKGRRRRVSA